MSPTGMALTFSVMGNGVEEGQITPPKPEFSMSLKFLVIARFGD